MLIHERQVADQETVAAMKQFSENSMVKAAQVNELQASSVNLVNRIQDLQNNLDHAVGNTNHFKDQLLMQRRVSDCSIDGAMSELAANFRNETGLDSELQQSVQALIAKDNVTRGAREVEELMVRSRMLEQETSWAVHRTTADMNEVNENRPLSSEGFQSRQRRCEGSRTQ